MPSTKTPRSGGKKDYVGPYDGSSAKWASRKMTDNSGEIRNVMAPVKSKPTEAFSYHAGYSPKSALSGIPKRGSRNK